MIAPRSILRMRVEKEEIPYSEVRFMSKTHQHERFKAWAKNIFAQHEMPKNLHDLGIMRAITQAWKIAVERNSEDLEFLMSRWSTDIHTFVASWGEFGQTIEDVRC